MLIGQVLKFQAHETFTKDCVFDYHNLEIKKPLTNTKTDTNKVRLNLVENLVRMSVYLV